MKVLRLPSVVSAKCAIMRAFNDAKNSSGDSKGISQDYLDKRELRIFLQYLRNYFEIFQMFQLVDMDSDDRISQEDAGAGVWKWLRSDCAEGDPEASQIQLGSAVVHVRATSDDEGNYIVLRGGISLPKLDFTSGRAWHCMEVGSPASWTTGGRRPTSCAPATSSTTSPTRSSLCTPKCALLFSSPLREMSPCHSAAPSPKAVAVFSTVDGGVLGGFHQAKSPRSIPTRKPQPLMPSTPMPYSPPVSSPALPSPWLGPSPSPS